MSKGWQYESGRHALASRGIKTNEPKWFSKKVPDSAIAKLLSKRDLYKKAKEDVIRDVGEMWFMDLGHGPFWEGLEDDIKIEAKKLKIKHLTSEGHDRLALIVLDRYAQDMKEDKYYETDFDYEVQELYDDYGIIKESFTFYKQPYVLREKYGKLFDVIKNAAMKVNLDHIKKIKNYYKEEMGMRVI